MKKKFASILADLRGPRLAMMVGMVIFAGLYSLESLVNFYLFRSDGLDMAYFNQVAWDYAHLQYAIYHLYPWGTFGNVFADHFGPSIFLFSWLTYFFGNYTLLLVQMGFILAGGIGMYKLVGLECERIPATLLEAKASSLRITMYKWLPFAAAIHFWAMFPVVSSLGFDYHTIVLAAMVLPWFFYFFLRQKWGIAFGFFLFGLLCKESVAIWFVFICIGLLFVSPGTIEKSPETSKKTLKNHRIAAIGLLVFTGLYFILVMGVIMPAFMEAGQSFRHFKYHVAGENGWEAYQTLINRPAYLLEAFFSNFEPQAGRMIGFKGETLIMVFLCGGFALLKKPGLFIMVLPIFLQKFLNDDPLKWSVHLHYCIEFTPLLTWVMFLWILSIKQDKWMAVAAVVAPLLCMALTYNIMVTPFGKKGHAYLTEKTNIFSKKHYVNGAFDVNTVYEALETLPPHGIISAQNKLTPHLAMRDTLYMFPKVHNADYIIVNTADSHYPTPTKEEFDERFGKYLNSPEWVVTFNKPPCIVLKRIR